MSFLTAILGIVIDKVLSRLQDIGIAFIKQQVKNSRFDTTVDEEVKAVEDAVKEADEFIQKGERVPDDIEEKLRNAARRLNGNFIN